MNNATAIIIGAVIIAAAMRRTARASKQTTNKRGCARVSIARSL
jgi:hypothetical protein